MRSTKASSAVERLKSRSGNPFYSMSCRPGDLFALYLGAPDGQSAAVGSPLPMDAFVTFVNGLHPAKPKRVSALDTAFIKQLKSGAGKGE